MGASGPGVFLFDMAGAAITAGSGDSSMMPSLYISRGSTHMAGIAGLRELRFARSYHFSAGAVMTGFTGGMTSGGISDNRAVTIYTGGSNWCGDKMR